MDEAEIAALHAHDVFEMAEKGDAVAAAELWRLIAAGKVPERVALAWLMNVATQVEIKVLDADLLPNRRADAALKAIGLEGRLTDPNRKLVEYITDLAEFGWTPESEGMSRAQMAECFRSLLPSVFKGLSDEQAMKLLDRARKRVPRNPDDSGGV